MASTLPFDTLLSLAKDALDAASKRLGTVIAFRTNAQHQLDMLVDYRQDYLVRLQDMMTQGIASSDCQNYQRFITTLDNALQQQRDVLQRADANVAQSRDQWQQAQRKHNAFDVLQVRDRRVRQAVKTRHEQRITDEFAGRSTLRLANIF